MKDYVELAKAAMNLGVAGLLLFVIWRLADKWAGPFLAAQKSQAEAMGAQAAAMTSLAQTIKEGQGEQREVLLAVRVMASKFDELRESVSDFHEEFQEHQAVQR